MNALLKNRINDALQNHLGVRLQGTSPMKSPDAYGAVRRLRNWTQGGVIFDVGANDGRTVDTFLRYYPNSQIHSFEPVSATFQKLKERVSGNENVHCHQLAMGATPGKAEIFLHEKTVLNSFSKGWAQPTGTETVSISTVDQIMREQEIEYLHFLKIDTEGHEMQVLEGAEEMLRASRIGIIKAEVGMNPLVSPHTPLREVIDLLSSRGYHLHGIFDQHRRGAQVPDECRRYEGENYGPTVASYCDAVFVRADLSSVKSSVHGAGAGQSRAL